MRKQTTCCVILAAGLSSRMGSFKPLLPIAGKPSVLFLLDNLTQGGVDSCVIVTGHNAAQIREACKERPNLIWGFNPEYASSGMLESAKIGFSLVPPECDRILLTPVDIPMVRPETIRLLAESEEPLLFPSFQHRKGHPVSLSAQFLPALLQYHGEGGLRGAFHSLTAEPSYLETDDINILRDMDTPEDYRKLLNSLKERNSDSSATSFMERL